MARGADKYGLFKASDAKRHGNLQPSGLSFRVHLGYGGSIPRFGRKSKGVPQPPKSCPSVVPVLLRTTYFAVWRLLATPFGRCIHTSFSGARASRHAVMADPPRCVSRSSGNSIVRTPLCTNDIRGKEKRTVRPMRNILCIYPDIETPKCSR